MTDSETLERIARLLEEIRDSQKVQLERQAEALAIQKQQFEVLLKQQEKTSRIQDRAEALQERSAQIVGRVQRFFPFAIVIVLVLILYLTWLLMRIWR